MKECKNIISGDCRLEAFRKILNLNGVNIGSEIIFGIGEGLDIDIIGNTMKNIKYNSLLGRDMDTELNSLCKLGIEYTIHKSEDFGDDIPEIMKKEIDKGEGIVVNVDRYYLDYLPIRKAHFGLHTIIINDYCDSNRYVKIIDSLVNEEVKVGYGILNKAMHEELDIFPPGGIWLSINKVNEKKLSNNDIKKSIINCCKKNINKSNEVIKNIENDIKKIEVLPNAEVRKAYINFQINYIATLILEEEPTQTMYRRIYSAYLELVADRLKNNNLKKYSEELRLVGERWTNMALKCREIDDYNQKFKKFISEIKLIAMDENNILKGIIDKI